MENSSLGPTQIPRRLANSRPIPGKSAPPAIPCIRGGGTTVHGSRRESESFRKASGSFSFGNREPLFPPPPRSNRYFPRRENDSGFSPSSFPRSGSTLTSPSLRPRNCDRSKTNGVPAFIDSKLDLLRPKIDRGFNKESFEIIWNKMWYIQVRGL